MSGNMPTQGSPGFAVQIAKRRELFGWSCAISYFFFMIWGYQIFIINDTGFLNGSWIDSAAMFAFAGFIAIFSFRYGCDPDGLTKIVNYTTPPAIVITTLFALLPNPFAPVLYIFACILMCPAIARSVYGVISTSAPVKKITGYMVGTAISFILFAFWIVLNLPKETAFLVPALLAVFTWFAIRRSVSLPHIPHSAKAIKFSKNAVIVFCVALPVSFWFNLMAEMMVNNLFAGGDLSSQSYGAVETLLTWIPLGLGIIMFTAISDRGYERVGFMIGMGFFLQSILFLILLNDSKNVFYLPIIIANLTGAIYVVFFIIAFPVYFLMKGSKQPVFSASIGVIITAAFQGGCWLKSMYLPDFLMRLGIPLYVSSAVSAVLFFTLICFLFERYNEKTLAAALYDFLYDKSSKAPNTQRIKSNAPTTQENALTAIAAQGNKTAALESPYKPNKTDADDVNRISDAGFTKKEIDVALLLLEGKMRSEITRKLRLSSADATNLMNSIRDKISGINYMKQKNNAIYTVNIEFKLTRRETDTLRCLCKKMTNSEIATELVISEETAKKHVHSLMAKLPVKDRKEVPAWMAAFFDMKETKADDL